MAQIGYVTLGTNDFESAVTFYDALLKQLGSERFIETDRGVSWTFGEGTTSLSVMKPFDGQPSTVGNGVMVALGMKNREEVLSIYAQAMKLGATDDGAPGKRGDAGFYAAYVRDLDGNKLALFCIESANESQ